MPWRQWNDRAALKGGVGAFELAMRDPRTPWAARIVLGLTLAYAPSPIDLIPDCWTTLS